MKNQHTGLVLEGGAMRGLFTAGVIDVFMESDIEFPACVGVSAGAAFGCNLKSRQIGRAIRYNTRFCKEPKYCSVRSLLKTGDIFGAEFCYHKIPDELDVFDVQTYESNPMAFYVVCSDVETGKPYYKRLDKAGYECYEWIRASASMPLVSKVVEIGDKKLLDGGMTDSIPLAFMEKQYAKNVVVLTQPINYIKKPASLMWLFKQSLKKYPKMIEAIANRHNAYNQTRDYIFAQERAGKAFVICPKEPLPIGKIEHDPENMRKIYALGRKVAEEKLEELRQFLSQE